MKKMMMTLAAALTATAIMAVESQNAVGYATKTLLPGFNMVAFNWDLVGDPETGVSVQDVFDTSGMTGATGLVGADNIQIHDASTGGYTFLFLYDGTGTSYTENNGLWCELNGTPSTRVVQNGGSFWLYSQSAGEVQVTLNGQVPNDTSLSRSILPGFNMFGSGFSADYDLNSGFDWLAAGATGATGLVGADNVQIHDASTSGYTFLFLYDGTGTSYTENNGKWCELNGTPTTQKIPIGQGFWYYSQGTNPAGWSWAETKPYTL